MYLVVKCGADQFRCHSGVCKWQTTDKRCNGPCIPKKWVNDYVQDCSDVSDESSSFEGFKDFKG